MCGRRPRVKGFFWLSACGRAKHGPGVDQIGWKVGPTDRKTRRLGSISKQGDRYLRRLFVLGAISIVGSARSRPDKYPWVTELLARRPAKVVAVALANKMARTAWAVLA